MKLKEELQKIIEYLNYVSEEDGYTLLVDLLHNHYKNDMLKMFLQIQQKDINDNRKENEILYKGLDESMSNIASLIEESNNKTSHKYNALIKFITKNEARMIRTAIAYFPKGVPAGVSAIGSTYLSRVVKLILNNKENYMKGGKNREWAQRNNYIEWIDNVLAIYNDDGTLKKDGTTDN